MHALPQDNYLATEVTTATPQKLQLMLIETVIRLTERARHHWHAGQPDQASEALIRGQEILIEMLGGFNRDVDPELTKKVAAVYLFLHRSLMEANFHRDEKRLDDALSVLQVERETWRLVCQLGSSAAAADAGTVALSRQSSSAPPQQSYGSTDGPFVGLPRVDIPDVPAGGLSFEA